MAKVRIRAISWLTRSFGVEESTGHHETVLEVKEGTTVRVLFDRLAAESKDFAEHVYDRQEQNLTGRVSIFFNDRVLELVEGLDTKIRDGDFILLVPAYAGG